MNSFVFFSNPENIKISILVLPIQGCPSSRLFFDKIQISAKIVGMKVVVRAPNWIGDSVLALPAIECLSQSLPEAQLWVAAKDWVKDIFQSLDFIKGTIPLSSGDDFKGLKNSAATIRSYDFDAGLLLTNSFASALLFSLAKIPERWGYSRDGRNLLLTKKVSTKKVKNSCHQADYYMKLISELGFQTSSPKLFFPLTEEEKKAAREQLLSFGADLTHPLVILNPGASYGPAKRWPAERVSELGRRLQDRYQATVLITGSGEEKDLAESIAARMTQEPINLCGQTSLRSLAGLISQSILFVTNDSGPMHLANALKVPVVAVFGPTDPAVTGPYQEPAVVIKKDVPCWPCSYRECPFDHRCMSSISSEEVYESCRGYLQ